MKRLLTLLLISLSLAANAEIRLYEVTQGLEMPINEALAAVLSLPDEKGNPSGVIELLPTGQLLVNTTPQLHTDIATLIEALENASLPAERNYLIKFWVIFVPDSNETVLTQQRLPDDQQLLSALSQRYDDRSMQLLMQASANSIASRNVSLNLPQGGVSFSLRAGKSGLSIFTDVMIKPSNDLTLKRGSNWNNVQAVLQPNEYLVLAESQQMLEQQPGKLLLVIQWDEAGV